MEGGLERCETAPGSILCASAVACNRCNKSSIMPALSFVLSLSLSLSVPLVVSCSEFHNLDALDVELFVALRRPGPFSSLSPSGNARQT